MYACDYIKPTSIAEAIAARGEDGAFLAGGQTIIPALKQRLAAPDRLIDLAGIDQLRGIRIEGASLRIGAMTTHDALAHHPLVHTHLPGLAGLAGGVGDPQVRHVGTIGGSIANNDPAADYPAALLALGATIETSARNLSAADFFTGIFDTALDDAELVVAIHCPMVKTSHYYKHRQPASRFALVGVYVARIAESVAPHRVAVTGAGANGVFRAKALEHALDHGHPLPPMSDEGLLSDIHGQADYRAHLIGVLTRRAIAHLNQE